MRQRELLLRLVGARLDRSFVLRGRQKEATRVIRVARMLAGDLDAAATYCDKFGSFAFISRVEN